MNGINVPRDDGFKNSIEMGLSSILGVLSSIDEGVENLSKTLTDFFTPSKQTNSTSDYTRLSYETLSSINLTLTDYFKKSSKLFGAKNKNEDTNNKNSDEMGFAGGMIVDKYYNITFGDIKENSIKKLGPIFKHFESILSKTDKLEKLSNFFKDFQDTIKGMDGLLTRVGKGMLFLSLGLAALQYVSVANVLKIVMILPLFALNLALFINVIMAATAKVGGGIGGFFKFGMLMFTIKDMFTDIGKGVAIMAIGLLILQNVNWETIFKLGFLFGSIVGVFHLLKSSEVAEFTVILSLSFMILSMVYALKKMENVSWNSVFQLPTFLLLTGLALRIARFDKVENIKLLNVLGISFLLLTAALVMFNSVPWSSVFQYPLFILGLGLALQTFNKINGSNSILSVASGMMMMAFSFFMFENLDVALILGIIGIIALLGIVVSLFFGNGKGINLPTISSNVQHRGMGGMGLVGLAIGLGFLVLAFYAFSEVQWSAVMKGLVVIAALGVIVKAFFTTRVSGIGRTRQALPPMIGFAVGLGLMVLSLDAMSELDWGSILKFLIFVGALGLIFKFLFPKNTKMSGMLGFGIGMSLIILSLDALSEIDWITVFKFVAVIAAIGAVFKYLLGNTGGLKMFLFAVSIGITAIALYQVGKQFTPQILGGVFLFALSVAIMGGLMWLMGKFITQIGPGILAALGIGVVTWLMGKALKEAYIGGALIASNWMSLLGFVAGVTVVTLVIGLLGLLVANPIVAPILAVGAVSVLILAGVTIVMAYALEKIGSIDYDPEKYRMFGESLGLLVSSIADNVNFLDALEGGAKAALMLPVLMVSLLGAGLLSLIGNLMNDPKLDVKVKMFSTTLTNLVNDFNSNIDGWEAAKGLLKAAPVSALLTTMYFGAGVIEKISQLDINEEKMKSFGKVFSNLIDTTLVTLNNNADKIKNAEPGIRAIAQLTSISGGVAKMVNDIANLNFHEYEVRDGKLVIKSTRKMQPSDFTQVGTSMGQLIMALIKPLEVLGADTTTWTLGSTTVKNPFKDSTMEKGIMNVKKITEAFKPFTDSIASYSKLGMIDATKANTFMVSLVKLSLGYKEFFNTMGAIDLQKATKTVDIISDYNELWEDVDYKAFKEMNDLLNTFIDKYSDQKKWDIIHKNMARMVKNTGAMVKNINSINVEKAKLFERNVKQLTDKRNFEYLKQVVEQFAQMFMIIQHNNAMMMSQQNQYIQDNTTAVQEQTKKIESGMGNSIAATTAGKKSDKEIEEMFAGWKKGDAAGKAMTMKIDNIYSEDSRKAVSVLDKDKDGMLEYSDIQQYIANQNNINELITVVLQNMNTPNPGG